MQKKMSVLSDYYSYNSKKRVKHFEKPCQRDQQPKRLRATGLRYGDTQISLLL